MSDFDTSCGAVVLFHNGTAAREYQAFVSACNAVSDAMAGSADGQQVHFYLVDIKSEPEALIVSLSKYLRGQLPC